MTLAREIEAEISRLYHSENWKVGTIAAQLRIHKDAVRRVLGLPRGMPCTETRTATPKTKLLDPFIPFLQETLARYPRLRASRLLDMVKERGFQGSARTMRRFVETSRPAPPREAFLRLDPLIGEQAQIDWAHVGNIPVQGGGTRSLWLFVMVLSWSRAMWGEFCFDTTVHSLLRSLSRAAVFFGGTTRQWLFDNPKIVVLERHRDAVRFHPLLLDLATAYHAQPRLCAPRRGNEKGRVERKIRFLRDRFLAARDIRSIEQGNRELLAFIQNIAHRMPHPSFGTKSIRECLAEEQPRLLTLPAAVPPTDLVEPAAVDKTAFIRFDTNDYSVPPDYVQRTLTLVADDSTVRLLDGQGLVATHRRCWGQRQRLELPEHRSAIVKQKQAASASTGRSRLRAVAPGVDVLVDRWVEAGRNVGLMVAQTQKLLDLYGEELFSQAVLETVNRGTHDPAAVGAICEKLRKAAERPVPIDLLLHDKVPDRDVIPHDLGGYDDVD